MKTIMMGNNYLWAWKLEWLCDRPNYHSTEAEVGSTVIWINKCNHLLYRSLYIRCFNNILRPGHSIFEALGTLSLGAPPPSHWKLPTHALYLYHALCRALQFICLLCKLHGTARHCYVSYICMTLASDCGLEMWAVNCVLRESYVAGTADRRKVLFMGN